VGQCVVQRNVCTIVHHGINTNVFGPTNIYQRADMTKPAKKNVLNRENIPKCTGLPSPIAVEGPIHLDVTRIFDNNCPGLRGDRHPVRVLSLGGLSRAERAYMARERERE
jgi:hypothetical protein